MLVWSTENGTLLLIFYFILATTSRMSASQSPPTFGPAFQLTTHSSRFPVLPGSAEALVK